MKPLIIANWKMKLLPAEQTRFARVLAGFGKGHTRGCSLVVCPSFDSIASVAPILEGSSIAVGAQDCFWEERGAYTGEVSPRALRQLGVSYVLVGHSERRIHLGEGDEIIEKKYAAAHATKGVQPILCIGESARARASGSYRDVIKKQLAAGLRLVPKSTRARLIIAYEPLWAISTAAQLIGTKGKPITPHDCSEVYYFLKKILTRERPLSTAVILYGGSATSKNICVFVAPGVSDGALVGGASVERAEMKKIIDIYSRQ